MRRKRSLCLLLALLLLSFRTGGAKAGREEALRAFADALAEHAEALDEQFPVPVDPDLLQELKRTAHSDREDNLLSDLRSQVGMTGDCQVIWYDNEAKFLDNGYYAGWRILRRYAAGQTDLLSDRERETLAQALEIAGNARGTDLEKERFIYDALCERITYESVDSVNGDNDCAIGALVNGRADCDGYADAMVLCCGLAGIPCGYIHGSAVDPPKDWQQDNSHMWNLVYIGGQWLMTDVTWGDQNSGISYMYFNIGEDTAAGAYRWNADCLFTPLAPEADLASGRMPDQMPVTVRTMEDVYNAARGTAGTGVTRLMLYCPDSPLWEQDKENFERMLQSGALEDFTYKAEGHWYELLNISRPGNFCFCDSEEQILDVIRQCAENGITSFRIYLHPSIAPALLANQCAGLNRVLAGSRLQSGYSCQYGEKSGMVAFTDVSFTGEIPRCASEAEMLALIRRAMPGQPSRVEFLLAEGLPVDQMVDRAAQVIYAAGAESISSMVSGSRVTLMIDSYFDSFCLAETEEDVFAYLVSVRNQGGTVARIYCANALYATLQQNNAERFFTLLQEAGFTSFSAYHSDPYSVLIADDLK